MVKICLHSKVFVIGAVLSVVLGLVGVPWYLLVFLFIIVNVDTWDEIHHFTEHGWVLAPILFIIFMCLWAYSDFKFLDFLAKW